MSRGSAGSRGMGVWTCRLQGVMPYPWPRSPVSFEWIGQPSVFQGISSHGSVDPHGGELTLAQHSFKGLGGVGLPSSDGDVLPIDKVPCEFRVDPANLRFSVDIQSRQHLPPWRATDFGAAQLPGGCGHGPAVFRGCFPTSSPRSPVSFERIGQPSFFRGK